MHAKQSLRHLRRTHRYLKDACSHRTWFEEAAIIPHAMRVKKYHFPSPAKTRRVGWRFYGLKYREMIQPVRISVAENEKRKDIRATIIHPIAV